MRTVELREKRKRRREEIEVVLMAMMFVLNVTVCWFISRPILIKWGRPGSETICVFICKLYKGLVELSKVVRWHAIYVIAKPIALLLKVEMLYRCMLCLC